MFESISRSWQLVKYSWAFLRRNKTFMVFPLLSAAGAFLATIALLLPAGIVLGIMSGGFSEGSGNVLGYVLAFLFYLVVYTISIYFNVALAGAVLKELDGEEATLRDGLDIANNRFGLIVQYAAVSATVGVVLNAVRERGGIIGSIAASLFGMAWNLVTFFVIPMLVVENKGIIDIIKDSGSLLKRTFGEQVVGGFGVGAIIGLVSLAVILVGVGLIVAVANSPALVGLVIALIVLTLVVIALVGSTLSSIYRVLVFRYAQSGEVPSDMDIALLQGAFKPKRKNS
jgi:hypothetical protein